MHWQETEKAKPAFFLATDRRFIFTHAKALKLPVDGISYNKVIDIYCFSNVNHYELIISVPENNIHFKFESRLYAQQFCEKVTSYLSLWKLKHIAEENDSNPDKDIFEQLEKLGDLWQKGILTNEEFTAQKQRLLDKL